MAQEQTKRGGGGGEDDDPTGSTAAGQERREKLAEDTDDLLDEIDDVLEENAEDFVRAFHQAGGILHVLDLADIMHRNYEIEFHTRMYGKPPEQISPLPPFLKELEAYNTNLARLGGGELLPLGAGDKITEQLMIAAFGPKWRKEVGKFAAGG